MKVFLLITLFSTPGNLEPHEVYPYGLQTFETLAACLQRRKMMLATLQMQGFPKSTLWTSFCTELGVNGYTEGLQAFRRKIGEQS